MTHQTTPDAPEVTGAVRNLLQRLAWRDDMGTSYLVHGPRGREILVGPALRRGGPLSRLSAYARSTIRHATDLGLITHGTSDVFIRFDYRQRLDGDHGCTITLTPDGWRALGHPDGKNPNTPRDAA